MHKTIVMDTPKNQTVSVGEVDIQMSDYMEERKELTKKEYDLLLGKKDGSFIKKKNSLPQNPYEIEESPEEKMKLEEELDKALLKVVWGYKNMFSSPGIIKPLTAKEIEKKKIVKTCLEKLYKEEKEDSGQKYSVFKERNFYDWGKAFRQTTSDNFFYCNKIIFNKNFYFKFFQKKNELSLRNLKKPYKDIKTTSKKEFVFMKDKSFNSNKSNLRECPFIDIEGVEYTDKLGYFCEDFRGFDYSFFLRSFKSYTPERKKILESLYKKGKNEFPLGSDNIEEKECEFKKMEFFLFKKFPKILDYISTKTSQDQQLIKLGEQIFVPYLHYIAEKNVNIPLKMELLRENGNINITVKLCINRKEKNIKYSPVLLKMIENTLVRMCKRIFFARHKYVYINCKSLSENLIEELTKEGGVDYYCEGECALFRASFPLIMCSDSPRVKREGEDFIYLNNEEFTTALIGEMNILNKMIIDFISSAHAISGKEYQLEIFGYKEERKRKFDDC